MEWCFILLRKSRKNVGIFRENRWKKMIERSQRFEKIFPRNFCLLGWTEDQLFIV